MENGTGWWSSVYVCQPVSGIVTRSLMGYAYDVEAAGTASGLTNTASSCAEPVIVTWN